MKPALGVIDYRLDYTGCSWLWTKYKPNRYLKVGILRSIFFQPKALEVYGPMSKSGRPNDDILIMITF